MLQSRSTVHEIAVLPEAVRPGRGKTLTQLRIVAAAAAALRWQLLAGMLCNAVDYF